MQPKLCSRCHKNVAVVFITKLDNNEPVNEGLCLKCARELGIKPVQDMMDRMGISDEDLEGLTSEMMSAFGGPEAMEELMSASEGEDEDDEGKTATFPYLGKLFSRNPPPEENRGEEESGEAHGRKERKSGKKSKYLENYCISLTDKAREGKMDEIIGREEEIARVIQILNRRQKNNPCLIGEPGVGKTAIAEALAQRIVAGKVPYKLQDKQVYLLDLTALVAGTQFRGQFESRMKGLISEVTKAGNIILVIDEVHNMVGAGRCGRVHERGQYFEASTVPGRDPGDRAPPPLTSTASILKRMRPWSAGSSRCWWRSRRWRTPLPSSVA